MLGLRSDRWMLFFTAAALIGLLLPLASIDIAPMRIVATILFVSGVAGICVAGAYAWQFDAQARGTIEIAWSVASDRLHALRAWVERLRGSAARACTRTVASLRDTGRCISPVAVRESDSVQTA